MTYVIHIILLQIGTIINTYIYIYIYIYIYMYKYIYIYSILLYVFNRVYIYILNTYSIHIALHNVYMVITNY